MKKPLVLLTAAVCIVAIMFSCAKEEALDRKDFTKDIDQLQQKWDAPPPDLIITTYFSDIPFESTLCTDTLLPTTHCDFGDAARNFTAFVLIQNIGVGALPAGEIEVNWFDLNRGLTDLTKVSHNGLAPQDTVVASKPYFVGPCDCVQFPTDGNCFIHRYAATVDPSNLIAESNEFNNNSDIFDTCDGCGPCAVPDVEPL